MRVILNVDAIVPPLTGIGRYALRLAEGLATHSSVSDVRYYAAYRWLDTPDAALRGNALLGKVRRHVPAKSLALRGYFWLRQRAFDRLTKARLSSYVLHSPNYMLFRHDGPSVATLHDFSWVHFPEHHPRERIELMRREMPKTYRQATCFITDSEFVKSEAIAIAGIDGTRIHVVPLGVDERYAPLGEERCAEVLGRHGLAYQGYLLAVSTIEPRKNLERLLRAYSALPDTARRVWPMVLVGVRGWRTEAIERLVEPLERSGQVRRLGYVSEEDLPAIYAGARAFAFVSLHEGFGLPPLEAMASGVPVVCSNVSALPEVCGDAAMMVDPVDEDAISSGLLAALSDEDWRAAAVSAGLRQASAYTWTACVERTVAVYKKAAES